jgi:hypothetical protein
MNSNITYNDLIFRILIGICAAHFIVSIGRYLSFLELIKLKNYPIAMIISTVIAGIIVEAVFRITSFLDRRYPWESVLRKRLFMQVLFGVISPLTLAVILASIYFGVFGVNILDTVYFELYFPSIAMMILLLNAYYMIHYIIKFYSFHYERGYSQYLRQKLVRIGREEEAVTSPEDILFIKCNKKVGFSVSASGAQNLWPYTMEETVSQLSHDDFLFIGHSYAVRMDNIIKITPASSRRYRLVLKVPQDKEVMVTQRRANQIRKLLKKDGIS